MTVTLERDDRVMSGHTPRRDLEHKSDVAEFDRWVNGVASIEVPEAVVDEFADELLDRLGGAGVLSVEQTGVVRHLELTVEQDKVDQGNVLEAIDQAAQTVGADTVRARLTTEYAWDRPRPA